MSNFNDTIRTLKGVVTGEPLISIWRHYPKVDFNIDKLVDTTVKEQKKFPSDLLKLSPQGRYCSVDFGCKIEKGSTKDKATGSSSCVECVVKHHKDWSKIKEIDPLDGHYGEQVRFVEKISKQITDVPIMATVFSPTMVARKLSNDLFLEHLMNEDKIDIEISLKIIDKVTTEFARACIDSGADGIFVATQEADKSIIESPDTARFLLTLNQDFMNTVNKKAEFTVLHIHGENVYFFEAVSSMPATGVNWHDQTADVNLNNAGKYFSGGLLGGLDPLEVFNGVSPNHIQELLKKKDEIPFILAPGCVILQGTPEKNLEMIFKKFK